MTSHAVDELVVLQPSGDFLEGAASFLQKRDPEFRGR